MFFILFAQARYYLPEVGRFISEDSYKGTMPDTQSQNRYIYCTNNPLKYVDPSGHMGYESFWMKQSVKSTESKLSEKLSEYIKTVEGTVKDYGKEGAINLPYVDTVNDATVLLTGYDIGLEKQSRLWAVAGILLPVSGQTIKRGVKAVDKIPAVNKVRNEIVEIVEKKLGKNADKTTKCELKVKNKDIETGTPNGKGKTDLDGIKIINKKYAGKTYILSGELAKKYPKGVKFSKEGFPDFNSYSIKKVKVKNLEGDSYYDFIKANEKSGFKSTPKGYTWHHVEDGKTLILVPTDLHEAVRHTGGAALIRKGVRP